jgi:hypothetical protein
MTGGLIMRAHKATERGKDSGDLLADGTSVIIVRDCNPTVVRTDDNAFGCVHLFVGVPRPIGWDCISLSLQDGMTLLSGHHCKESFAHPQDGKVGRLTRARIWAALGPPEPKQGEVVYSDDAEKRMHDSSVVMVQPTVKGIKGVQDLCFTLAPSGSPTLSDRRFILPTSATFEVNPLAAFFNCMLPLDTALCRLRGRGTDSTSILEVKHTVYGLPQDSQGNVSASNVITGKRRRSVVKADEDMRCAVLDEANVTDKGFLTPHDKRYASYAADARKEGWRDNQLAAGSSDSDEEDFFALTFVNKDGAGSM